MEVSRGRHWLNRTLLALLGLAGLAAGCWVAVAGLDARGQLPFALPSWWPSGHPRAALTDRLEAAGLRDHAWWPAAVLGCLTLGLLLLAGWLLAQTGPREPRRLPLHHPAPGAPGRAEPAPHAPTLRTSALSGVMAAQVTDLPGVRRARVRLTGGPRRPRARVTVVLDTGADPRAVLTALCAGPLTHARHSTGLPHLPSGLRLRVAPPGTRRAR
ncbi:alkaline shock response membrane anchor protein AmaP [Streptomyces sp. 71268]|uniref:alkaline shock response membrane anchor protein AmaP n=1 Tax=Streptomyces sp. 71268 TaxID=3002640 RepID=UPI0023F729DA|nr:alkaline shock response membrane anchor protein AmaP [Streptomyces sp. 71268]WEV26238.1 alkaline shock response membrane anchor protein AmaP [Streptomyces sp. 71268]